MLNQYYSDIVKNSVLKTLHVIDVIKAKNSYAFSCQSGALSSEHRQPAYWLHVVSADYW